MSRATSERASRCTFAIPRPFKAKVFQAGYVCYNAQLSLNSSRLGIATPSEIYWRPLETRPPQERLNGSGDARAPALAG